MKSRLRASENPSKIMNTMDIVASELRSLVHIRIPSQSWRQDGMKSLCSFQKLDKGPHMVQTDIALFNQ